MKFTIQRDPLFTALQKVQSVVEKRNTVQILSNILCVVKDDTLSLLATDLEVGIKISLPIQTSGTKEDGKITLAAKQFLDIVKELPSQELKISKKDNNWIEILCGKSRFNIVSLSADEYPNLPAFEDKKYHEARTEVLKRMIERTSFAVSTDATRYHLNGVCFEPLENNITRMTATDGHRLAFEDQELFKESIGLKRSIIIPRKGLNEIKKLLEESETSIGLAFEKGYLFLNTQDSYLFVRLIEGEYPDYRQVIPKSTTKSVVLGREQFFSALKRVSLLAHEKSRGVKFALEKNNLKISSSNPDMGEAYEELEVAYEGEAIDIGFNARYVLDCLNVLETENFEFRFKEKLSPAIIHPQEDSKEQSNYTYVIMPMRI